MIEEEPDPLLWIDPAPEQVANFLLYMMLKYWRREAEREHQRSKKKKKKPVSRRQVSP
jgi:hypothetical protein